MVQVRHKDAMEFSMFGLTILCFGSIYKSHLSSLIFQNSFSWSVNFSYLIILPSSLYSRNLVQRQALIKQNGLFKGMANGSFF